MASDDVDPLHLSHKAQYDKQSAEYKEMEYKDGLWRMIAEQLGTDFKNKGCVKDYTVLCSILLFLRREKITKSSSLLKDSILYSADFFHNGLINTHRTQCAKFLCLVNFEDDKYGKMHTKISYSTVEYRSE